MDEDGWGGDVPGGPVVKDLPCNAADVGLTCGLGTKGFPGSSAGKDSACNAGDQGLIPRSGRSAGEGLGYPLQYPGLENSRDHIVHGVAKGQTPLSNFHFHFGELRSHIPQGH